MTHEFGLSESKLVRILIKGESNVQLHMAITDSLC
jgi:hypothetical protein